ncbi:MAG: hypothetical protein ACE5RI_06765 [Candidatus Nitrosomaritimum yanchengensis]
MKLQYSNERKLVASCPECRSGSLVLVTATLGSKSKDALGCKLCKFSIWVDEYKKLLYSQ